MAKTLQGVVVLLASLALAGTVFAGQVCGPVPACWKPHALKPRVVKPPKQIVIKETVTKKVSSDTILHKGKRKGVERIAGPCGPANPVIKWSCRWSTVLKGPEVEAKYLVTKRAKLVKVGKPKGQPKCFGGYRCPF